MNFDPRRNLDAVITKFEDMCLRETAETKKKAKASTNTWTLYAHWRNRASFACVYMTCWYMTVLYLTLEIAERERSCCKKKSSHLAEQSTCSKAGKLHPSRWRPWQKSLKTSSHSTAHWKGSSTKPLLKDTRNPRQANVAIVVVNTNKAAPRALHTGKLVQVVVNQIILPAFAHKEWLKSVEN